MYNNSFVMIFSHLKVAKLDTELDAYFSRNTNNYTQSTVEHINLDSQMS